VRFEYRPDGAEISYQGHVTGAEILDAKARFFGHGFKPEARWVLCDFSGVAKFDVSPDDVRRIIRQDLAAVETHPDLAEVVVASTPLEYGMARMWEQQVDEKRPRTAVVTSRHEALAWLHGLGIDVMSKPA